MPVAQRSKAWSILSCGLPYWMGDESFFFDALHFVYRDLPIFPWTVFGFLSLLLGYLPVHTQARRGLTTPSLSYVGYFFVLRRASIRYQ
jgi:hypothetical protein